MNPELEKSRRHVRSLTGIRVRRGSIKREPCEVCALPQAQAHHRDYDDPILINRLCVQCHSDLHRGRLDAEIALILADTAAERRKKIGLELPHAMHKPVRAPVNVPCETT